jgi:tubulin--tyrosine ligase
MCVFISSLNKVRLVPAPIVLYRAFVGKGNNSILIKNAIKNRFWWNIVPEKTNNSDVNFVWGQQRDTEYVNDLASGKGKVPTIEKQNEVVKKQKYHLQARPDEKEQPIREFTRHGFARLLSEKELKDNNFTPLYAETVAPESLQEALDPQKVRIHNHLEFNWNLTNKKALFYNLKTYYELIKDDPFKYIPLTFHVKEIGDSSWEEFKQVYEEKIREREENNKDQGSKEQVKKKKKDKK